MYVHRGSGHSSYEPPVSSPMESSAPPVPVDVQLSAPCGVKLLLPRNGGQRGEPGFMVPVHAKWQLPQSFPCDGMFTICFSKMLAVVVFISYLYE